MVTRWIGRFEYNQLMIGQVVVVRTMKNTAELQSREECASYRKRVDLEELYETREECVFAFRSDVLKAAERLETTAKELRLAVG